MSWNLMKKESFHQQIASNESGFILVLALMMLIVLVVIGLTSSNTARIELRIAGNDRFHKLAFASADSAIYAAPKLIAKIIDSSAPLQTTDLGDFDYYEDGNSTLFFRQIIGYGDDDNGTMDLSLPMNNGSVTVNITRVGAFYEDGSPVEFASGNEGIGTTGGIGVHFDVDSFGTGPNNSKSYIQATYRKVVGVPGGL